MVHYQLPKSVHSDRNYPQIDYSHSQQHQGERNGVLSKTGTFGGPLSRRNVVPADIRGKSGAGLGGSGGVGVRRSG